MSTSETIETKITTSVRYLIFHQEDSVRDHQTKAEDISFLYVLLVWGAALTSLLIKKRQSLAFVLRYDTYVSGDIFLAAGSPVELCRLWYKI